LYENRDGTNFKQYGQHAGTTYNGVMVQYGTNNRSELISAVTYLAGSTDKTNPAGALIEINGRRFDTTYDGQGNRMIAGVEGQNTTYSNRSDDTSQYAGITYPGAVNFSGEADTDATVTINDPGNEPSTSAVLSEVRRNKDYFNALLQYDSVDGGADLRTLSINSVDGAQVSQERADILVKKGEHTQQYDYAGNLTGDGVWEYVYDAENRLIRMNSTELGRSLEFAYDYLGRRTSKKVYDNASYSGTPAEEIRFIYHGWNLIAELDGSSGSSDNSIRLYGWGLDVSGTLDGAGGVGGLLIVGVSGGGNYLPVQDRLGNVYALVEEDTGVAAAAYEYDPFGNLLRSTGSLADVNPMGFSTKYTDRESDLVYYGYRFYFPEQGRFLNRDPIGEQGGENLYGFVGNNPVNRWDYLGLLPAGLEPLDDELLYSSSGNRNGGIEVLDEFVISAGASFSVGDDFAITPFTGFNDSGGNLPALDVLVTSGGGGGGTVKTSSNGKLPVLAEFVSRANGEEDQKKKRDLRSFFAENFLNAQYFENSIALYFDLQEEDVLIWKIPGYGVLIIGTSAAIVDTVSNLSGIKGLGNAIIRKGVRLLSFKAARNASRYEDVTRAGSRFANRATDVTKSQFERNLLDSGFTRSVSRDGKAIILENDGARYILRDGAKSTGGPTADFYRAGSSSPDLKIRLEQGGP